MYDKDRRYYPLEHQNWVTKRSSMVDASKSKNNLVIVSICAFFFITFMVIVLSTINFMEVKKTPIAAYKNVSNGNPAINAEFNIIQGQVNALIAGSIESKLMILENSLRTGKVQLTDYETIRELKHELNLLKTNSLRRTMSSGDALFPHSGLQVGSRGGQLINSALITEIAALRHLFYVSIASCGLLLAIVGSAWLRSNYKLKQIYARLDDPRVIRLEETK